MKHRLLLLLLCLLLVSFTGVSEAQVTVLPHEPSTIPAIMQIDGVQAGLRLSRLSKDQRDALSVSGNTKAKGLVIYNTTSNMIEFWDGNNWRPLGGNTEFLNGLNLPSTHAQLGGTLIENTEIDLNGNNFSVTTGAGSLTVNTNNLVLNNSDVKLDKLTGFSINDLLTIENNNDVKINTASDGFYINMPDTIGVISRDTIHPVLSVVDNNVKIHGNLQYKDGNEGTFPANSTHILFSDADGNARWDELTPSTETKSFSISRASGTDFSINTWTDITSSVTLGSGKWLIMGRFATYTSEITSGSTNYLSMLRLLKNESGADEEVFVSGILPERKSTSGTEPAGSYAMPQMVTSLDITTEGNYRIQFRTGKSNTWYTTGQSWVGDSYFIAIRIND